MSDIVLTWPKTRPLESYLTELAQARDAGLVINYRVAHPPNRNVLWVGRAPRCYMVHDGAVRGYTMIRDVLHRDDGEVRDPVTGGFWPEGFYVVREPRWFEVNPITMGGFRGWRFFKESSARMVAS